jgi:hypothetical protein
VRDAVWWRRDAELFFSDIGDTPETTNAIALSLLGMTLMAEPAFAQSPYDGLWDVVIQTKAGTCEPSLQYPVTIADGRISGAADVSGSVGREG